MTFLLGSAPIPITDAISRPRRGDQFGKGQVDPLEGTMSDPWVDYLSRLVLTVQASATRISSATKVDQAAAIAATDITGEALKAGLYRLTYHARITVAAGVSSSLTLTLSWTDGAVAQSQSFAAITGNTTATMQSGALLIHIDTGSPVRYATAYASNAAGAMQYRIDVVLEVIQA